MQDFEHKEIPTSHGLVSVTAHGNGYPVLFIHGNSGSQKVFRKQMASPIFTGFRFITFDLLGHGKSADAADPQKTYTRAGLADLTIELLELLNVDQAAIVGHSLGGHIAIEMLAKSNIPTGLFLMGTPAVGTNMSEGFKGSPISGLSAQSDLTKDEAILFASTVFGPDFEPFMLSDILRTDRVFRSTLFAAARKGVGVNQREVLMATIVPTAIVNGADDTMINLTYVDEVPYGNLWHGECFKIPFTCHSAFWQDSSTVNAKLLEFLNELEFSRTYGV